MKEIIKNLIAIQIVGINEQLSYLHSLKLDTYKDKELSFIHKQFEQCYTAREHAIKELETLKESEDKNVEKKSKT